MIDHEVENTLREIRERVLAETARAQAPDAQDATPHEGTNGAAHLADAPDTYPPAQPNGSGALRGGDALARLQANLSTTERAWSRLPPLMSYRRGWVARLELWFKRLIKRAAHWFTWEQVNFNSAVHHALGDARDALAAQWHALAQAQTEAQAEAASLRAETEDLRALVADLRARLSAAEARNESAVAELTRALVPALEQLRADQRAFAERLRAEQEENASALRGAQSAVADELRAEQRSLTQGLRDEQMARVKDVLEELRQRADRLLEEQRVCFRQLSLEAGESAVTQDRARRHIERRLDELEKKVTGEG